MVNFTADHKLIPALERRVQPLLGFDNDYETIIKAIEGRASAKKKIFVLIGEATHGTAEFYRIRAEITRDLIMQQGFDAVAVEADWPDAYRVNRYVCGWSDDANGDAALADFERFPTWMWRNTEVRAFIEWLHDYNGANRGSTSGMPQAEPVGFYGLDLYSMTTSMQAVLRYLDKVDPAEAAAARARYACFGQYINDPQAYGFATASGMLDSCEQEVVAQLMQLQQKARLYIERDGVFAGNEFFSAQQNAELVRNAEEYYRAMFRGRPNTWNLRDRHMFETLQKLFAHLSSKLGREARIVVWAHNSHVGNAAATDMRRRGEINIGQLVKEEFGEGGINIGFSTSRGKVTAASDWDGPAETKTVREPLKGSYEEIFSQLRTRRFLLDLRTKCEVIGMLEDERLQRAIGVIYRPETERVSHYFHTCLPRQFDFMIHIDETDAVVPLPSFMHKRPGEMDETYPSGL